MTVKKRTLLPSWIIESTRGGIFILIAWIRIYIKWKFLSVLKYKQIIDFLFRKAKETLSVLTEVNFQAETIMNGFTLLTFFCLLAAGTLCKLPSF